MNPKWYPGYFLDPQRWPEWMPDVMDQWSPSSPVRTPPVPSPETWPAPSPKPSYALFSDSLEGPRPKSIEEQRAELPSLLPYVPPSKPNAELLWTGLLLAPPQPEPLPNSPLPANAAKSLPPLFPRWPDYVMTTAGVPAKVAGFDGPGDVPATRALPVQWPAVSAAQPQTMLSAPAVPYTESANYWGAGPNAAADPLLVPYLAPVPAAQDARLAAAMRLGQWQRRGTQEYESPGPLSSGPPVPHVESANSWGAGPTSAAEPQAPYLSPVPPAPNWEQVPVAPTRWSPLAPPPTISDWGKSAAERVPGPECYASADGLTCVTRGGREVSVPSKELPPGLRIAPGDQDYHYYYVRTRSSDPQRELTPGLMRNPTPGPRGTVFGTTEQGTQNAAAPWYAYYGGRILGVRPVFEWAMDMPFSPDWPVKSYKTTDQSGTPVAVNVTEPGHPLYPGVVMRYETKSPSGPAIQTEGTGLGWLQGPRSWIPQWFNNRANEVVWGPQSRDIIERRYLRGYGQPLR